MTNSRCSRAGSKRGWLPKTCSSISQATSVRSSSTTPRAVSSYPLPLRASSSSSKWRRSRASAALVAGWLRPIRSPALVTLRSASSARSATTRFMSSPARFIRR